MVSLRRRRLLGLCSGKSTFQTPFSKSSSSETMLHNNCHNFRGVSVHPMPANDVNESQVTKMIKGELSALDESRSSLLKEHHDCAVPGESFKRRKQHRRKPNIKHEPCLLRGVYFKNMKWQAAIKVDKKQIHLGTVSSQEEAAHLYDRAAFMCGREPNFTLSEKEKQELNKFKWEEFLEITRREITTKKKSAGPQEKSESSSPSKNWDGK